MLKDSKISDRELEILGLIATSAGNKQIAAQLTIGENTVKMHIRNIFNKLTVTSRTEAALCAIRIELFGMDEVEFAPILLSNSNIEGFVSSGEFNPDAEVYSAGFIVSNLFFDDMESGSGNWTFGERSGGSAWMWDFGYCSSGTRMFYGWDGQTNSDSYAAMSADVTLPGGSQPFLHFDHSFGFDQPNKEEDWLEYSTNCGSSWSDAGSLFDDKRDYTGTISGSGSNPNPVHQAFIGDSLGYVSSRYDLSSLAVQDVRFRWRMRIDNAAARDLSWVVDDVQIYTCNHALFLPLVDK